MASRTNQQPSEEILRLMLRKLETTSDREAAAHRALKEYEDRVVALLAANAGLEARVSAASERANKLSEEKDALYQELARLRTQQSQDLERSHQLELLRAQQESRRERDKQLLGMMTKLLPLAGAAISAVGTASGASETTPKDTLAADLRALLGALSIETSELVVTRAEAIVLRALYETIRHLDESTRRRVLEECPQEPMSRILERLRPLQHATQETQPS